MPPQFSQPWDLDADLLETHVAVPITGSNVRSRFMPRSGAWCVYKYMYSDLMASYSRGLRVCVSFFCLPWMSLTRTEYWKCAVLPRHCSCEGRGLGATCPHPNKCPRTHVASGVVAPQPSSDETIETGSWQAALVRESESHAIPCLVHVRRTSSLAPETDITGHFAPKAHRN